jgi:alkanesulfonate monooxygenase SsuD/methylene tetrahydromethanopterin reductase-like flavin-dependent oxidoreductase (luciferase family)
MKFGLYLPLFEDFADPRRAAALAATAEQAGWDGLFVWDHLVAQQTPVGDAWTTLAAIAMTTDQMAIGPMVTPLARRRPWTLARQIAAVDQLSGGRLVAGVGLGDDGWQEFSSFGEAAGQRERGQLLDESLEILQQLLSGAPVSHHGTRYDVEAVPFLPLPVQRPVPIWAACWWPNRKPLARAARLQGCFPVFSASGRPGPPDAADLGVLRAELRRHGAPDDHDLVVRCATHRLEAAERGRALATLAGSGVTWVLEAFSPRQPAAEVEAIVQAGPPPAGTGRSRQVRAPAGG